MHIERIEPSAPSHTLTLLDRELTEPRRNSRFNRDFGGLLAIANNDVALQHVNRIERLLLVSQGPLGRVDDYPVRVLANLLRRSEGPEEARDEWRSFVDRMRATNGRGLQERHLAAFDISDAAIADIFSQVGEAKADGDADASSLAEQRAAEDRRSSTERVVRPIDRRSLDGLNTNGMGIIIT